MSLGEKAIIRCSSDFAYGSEGAGGVIPPYAGGEFCVIYLCRCHVCLVSFKILSHEHEYTATVRVEERVLV